jgi:amidase
MKIRLLQIVSLIALVSIPLRADPINLETATIADLQAAMSKGTLTAEKLTQLYLARIAAYDAQGPNINSIIYANSKALDTARMLDAERNAGKVRGPLHGIPIVLKDNYNTFDMPTTAGCQMLDDSYPPADAFVVKKLRDAGAIILAKVNLSEFAGGGGIMPGSPMGGGYRAGGSRPSSPPPTADSPRHGANIPGAQSTQGGLTVNPHDLTRSVAGSSGGTGAAIAADFAQFGMGSDTGGSIRLPCSACGIAGLKPTLGLLSRSGIVPLALSFDTGGPMARSVYDVAVALGVMTGVDASDPASQASAGKFETDYTKYLKVGARIGVARDFFGKDAGTDKVMEASIAKLKELGAVVVDPIKLPEPMMAVRMPILMLMIGTEFKWQIADYLATLKPGYPRDLAELAKKAADPETHYRSDTKRDGLKRNDETAYSLSDPLYLAAKNQGIALIKASMWAVFMDNKLDALVYPTSPRPATVIGAAGGGGGMTDTPSGIANETGCPDLIVPAGMTSEGLPVTISFFGLAYSEPKLLGYGYDFEQATHALKLPKYTPALPTDTISN